MQDQSVQVGTLKLQHLARSIPVEQLDKQWQSIPTRPTPTPEEIKTLTMLEQRLGESKRAKQKKHDIWNYSYLQYRSVNFYSMLYGGFPTYWNQWGTGVFIPRTFETIESMKVQMLSRDPDFTVMDTTPSQSEYSRNMNNLAHSEWRRSKTQEEVCETVHDALIYGAGIVRTDLINDKKSEHTLSWQSDGTIKYALEVVQKYFGVGARRVDPYDFYPNPSIEGHKMMKLGWGFERSVTDAWELREHYRFLAEQGAIGVTDAWQYLKPGGDLTNYKYLRQEVDGLYVHRNDQRYPGNINDLVGRSNALHTVSTTDLTKGKVEVWEYWENDRFVVIANGLILRDSPNPYPHKQLPYLKFNAIDMNEFWGMGIPEVIRWLQTAENILYDQGLNNIIMTVHKMFAVNARYLEDEGELVARPFGIIHMKQIPGVKIGDAIMPIEYSHQMGNYFEFMRLNDQNIQTVTGVTPFMTGGTTKETKYERKGVADRVAFAGSSRVREISRHMETSLVAGIVEQYIAVMQFYYQNAQAFDKEGLPIEVYQPGLSSFVKFIPRSKGDITESDVAGAQQEGYTGVIAQDEIQGRFRVVVEGGSSLALDPEDRANLKLEFAKFAQTAVETVQGMGVDPKTGQPAPITSQRPVFDIRKIGKDVAKEVFQISNPDDYMMSTGAPNATPPANGLNPPPEETPEELLANAQPQ